MTVIWQFSSCSLSIPRNPGHRRGFSKWYSILWKWEIRWVLVGSGSSGGELRARRLSKGHALRPECKSCLWSTGCLPFLQLWHLQRWRMEALVERRCRQDLRQQRSQRWQNASDWGTTVGGLKHHRVDPSRRIPCSTGAFQRCQPGGQSLHNSNRNGSNCRHRWTQRQPRGLHLWLCGRAPADRRLHRDSSHSNASKQSWSRLWCLPGGRWSTGEEGSHYELHSLNLIRSWWFWQTT